MKRLKRLLIFIVIPLLIFMIYIVAYFIRNFDYRREYSLYEYIQYNNTNYYIAEKQDQSEMKSISNYYVPVYLVDDSGTVHDDHVYYANIYNNDKENTYLYFNSAIYTKDPELASSHYRLPSEKSTTEKKQDS